MVQLIDTVLMGLQSSSAPSVLPLDLPLGSPVTIQWLAVGICICIGQVLVEPLRGQLYQASVSKHFLTLTIVLGCGVCTWDVSLGGPVSGWSFLHFLRILVTGVSFLLMLRIFTNICY